MMNIFFADEEIKEDDLYFICYIIEKIARKLKVRNKDVVNKIGYNELVKKISLANVLHSENPLKVIEDWIDEYQLECGNFNILDIDKSLVDNPPTELQMGKVYSRLILNTLEKDEDYINGLIRVYNDEICETIDNYNCSAYYQPTPLIVKSYYNGGF